MAGGVGGGGVVGGLIDGSPDRTDSSTHKSARQNKEFFSGSKILKFLFQSACLM